MIRLPPRFSHTDTLFPINKLFVSALAGLERRTGSLLTMVDSSTLLFDGDYRAIGQTRVDARAVFYIARQLPASCGDIVAARFTYCSDHTRIHQTLGKQADARGRRPFQTRLRERIEGDQLEKIGRAS